MKEQPEKLICGALKGVDFLLYHHPHPLTLLCIENISHQIESLNHKFNHQVKEQ